MGSKCARGTGWVPSPWEQQKRPARQESRGGLSSPNTDCRWTWASAVLCGRSRGALSCFSPPPATLVHSKEPVPYSTADARSLQSPVEPIPVVLYVCCGQCWYPDVFKWRRASRGSDHMWLAGAPRGPHNEWPCLRGGSPTALLLPRNILPFECD
jgi:hypothetical protein